MPRVRQCTRLLWIHHSRFEAAPQNGVPGEERILTSSPQCGGELRVAVVVVAGEFDSAVIADAGGPVEDVDRLGRLQREDLVLAGVDGTLDRRGRPLRLISQEVQGEIEGTFQADAAVAEGTEGLREQFLGGRVVQVDVVGIRQVELDAAQRVPGAGQLPNASLRDNEVLALEVRRVAALLRPDLLVRDAVCSTASARCFSERWPAASGCCETFARPWPSGMQKRSFACAWLAWSWGSAALSPRRSRSRRVSP
jgi:hypothetical protein